MRLFLLFITLSFAQERNLNLVKVPTENPTNAVLQSIADNMVYVEGGPSGNGVKSWAMSPHSPSKVRIIRLKT